MAEGFRDYLGGLEEYRLDAKEYRELDEERVLVLTGASGRGKTSGLEIEHVGSKLGAALFYVRDGRVAKLAFYWDRDNALADIGLAPEGDATR